MNLDVNLSDPVSQARVLSIILDVVAIAIVAIAIHKVVKKNNPPPMNDSQETKVKEDLSEVDYTPKATMEVEALMKKIQELEDKKEALRLELWKSRRTPSESIGLLFIPCGAIAFILSIFFNSLILAYIGLGLTLWGALLLLIRQIKCVKNKLLDSTAMSSLTSIGQLIEALNYKGKGIYLPPQYLKAFKGGTIFVPYKKDIIIPPIEEIAQEKVFLKNPKGICFTPPGLSLANLYEDELGTDFATVNLAYLRNNLPKLFIKDLEIAEDLEMNTNNNTIHVKIVNSTYKHFCKEARKFSNICGSIGCPLCSSIACALTRATGKPIIIEKTSLSADGKTIEANYQIIEG